MSVTHSSCASSSVEIEFARNIMDESSALVLQSGEIDKRFAVFLFDATTADSDAQSVLSGADLMDSVSASSAPSFADGKLTEFSFLECHSSFEGEDILDIVSSQSTPPSSPVISLTGDGAFSGACVPSDTSFVDVASAQDVGDAEPDGQSGPLRTTRPRVPDICIVPPSVSCDAVTPPATAYTFPPVEIQIVVDPGTPTTIASFIQSPPSTYFCASSPEGLEQQEPYERSFATELLNRDLPRFPTDVSSDGGSENTNPAQLPEFGGCEMTPSQLIAASFRRGRLSLEMCEKIPASAVGAHSQIIYVPTDFDGDEFSELEHVSLLTPEPPVGDTLSFSASIIAERDLAREEAERVMYGRYSTGFPVECHRDGCSHVLANFNALMCHLHLHNLM